MNLLLSGVNSLEFTPFIDLFQTAALLRSWLQSYLHWFACLNYTFTKLADLIARVAHSILLYDSWRVFLWACLLIIPLCWVGKLEVLSSNYQKWHFKVTKYVSALIIAHFVIFPFKLCILEDDAIIFWFISDSVWFTLRLVFVFNAINPDTALTFCIDFSETIVKHCSINILAVLFLSSWIVISICLCEEVTLKIMSLF